jgi:excisionase family DNA binding protein
MNARDVTKMGDRRLVSIAVAAEYADVCQKTLRRWIASGQIPGYRMGARLIRVDLDDIDQMLEPLALVSQA